MKFYTLLLLFLFASLFLIDARRVHSRHRRHLKSRGPSDNVLYQFLMGTLAIFSGQPSLIDECSKLIPGWESVGVTEKEDSSVEKLLKGQISVWDAVLLIIKNTIDYV